MRERVVYVGTRGVSGVAEAGRRLRRSLHAAGVPTRAVDERSPRATALATTTIVDRLPPMWPEFPATHRAPLIARLAWEAERLPGDWAARLRAADAVWVPAAWSVPAFAPLGVPVHVVPECTAPFLGRTPAALPVPLGADRRVFLDVAAWDWRKRPDRTIEAFLTAFDADDPVTLVIKTTPWPVAWPGRRVPTHVHVADIIRRHRRPARVVVITRQLSEAQLHALLRRADCYVSMTSNEGWGLGAFDSATLGTPVVITGWGAHTEWIGAAYPGLVPYDLVEVSETGGTSFEAGMRWAEPDLDATVERLRTIADSPDRWNEPVARLSRRLREDYDPRTVGRRAREALR